MPISIREAYDYAARLIPPEEAQEILKKADENAMGEAEISLVREACNKLGISNEDLEQTMGDNEFFARLVAHGTPMWLIPHAYLAGPDLLSIFWKFGFLNGVAYARLNAAEMDDAVNPKSS